MAMKTNTMSSNSFIPHKQPLFSIEQTELLRRLRNSGITREQIIIAFDSLQNIDNDIGQTYNVPISNNISTSYIKTSIPAYRNNLIKIEKKHYEHDRDVESMKSALASATKSSTAIAATSTTQATNNHHHHHNNNNNNNIMTSSTSAEPTSTTTATATTTTLPQHNNTLTNDPHDLVPLSPQSMDTKPAYVHQPSLAPVPTTMDLPNDSEELVEFLKLGPVGCCDEIRNFVIRHSIKQQQIATLSGISQSYVSRYLKGDFYDVSERSRLAMHKWYVAYRSDPGSIGTVYGASLMAGMASPKVNYSMLGKVPSDLSQFATDYMNSPRRERFVFRARHLVILENSFKTDSYPSHDRRDSIACSCNSVTEEIVNRALTEKERVTPQIVSNWFANKRKDMRKLAREEGLISQVPFRARGRPCRPSAFNAQAPIHATNSPGQPETSLPIGGLTSHNLLGKATSGVEMTSSQHLQTSQDAASDDISDDSPDPSTNGCSAIENAVLAAAHISGSIPSSTDDCLDMADDYSLNGDSEKSRTALSISVEMAAVNQAIMSLTGQNPIKIKNEE